MGLAERMGGEIISVDSVQVYREMNIGSAKPPPEMLARVRHHLIDVVDPEDTFTAAECQKMARRTITEATVPLVLCGGSGLHFRSVVDPLMFAPHDAEVRIKVGQLTANAARDHLLEADPEAGRVLDLTNPRRVARALEVLQLTGDTPSQRAADPLRRDVRDYRPKIPFRAVGLDPGDGIGERVAARLEIMRRSGFLDEVASLADRMSKTASQAVGYRQLLAVVRGQVGEEDGFRQVERATMALVKRQRTYFRRDPRVKWLPWSSDPDERLDRAWEAISGDIR
jgi:tRNA dimethylallyltransferase